MPVPPITDDEPDDWEDFCAAIINAGSTFLKIPGITVLFNGTAITDAFLGTYAEPPEITFQFSPRLQDYLDENPDVSITAEWEQRCDPGPFNPQFPPPVTITDGSTITPQRHPICGDVKNTVIWLNVKLSANPARNLFDEICCTPYGTSCSVQEISMDQIEYDIDFGDVVGPIIDTVDGGDAPTDHPTTVEGGDSLTFHIIDGGDSTP